MNNKRKDSLFINIDLKEIEKSIDNFLKEKCEGFSAIFLVPKFKDFLVNEVNNINIIFQNELNNLSEKMIDSFKNENNNNDFFYPIDFFPIKDKNSYYFVFERKSKLVYGFLYEHIYRIENLDNPNNGYDSKFYRITKEKKNYERILETEVLFIGTIEYKKDAEKLFEMLGIL